MGQYDKSTFDLLSQAFTRVQEIQITSSGDSMYPLIKEGDACVFVRVSSYEINKGDILLFRNTNGILIGHRFYYKDELGFYYCKGDSNHSFDRPVKDHQILGKLNKIQKKKSILSAHSWAYKMWGFLIMHTPLLPRLLRKYLNIRHA